MNNFDLEGAIALWRERLAWRDAFTDSDLDEMESHLRDEVEALVASGTQEQIAFHQTVRSFDDDMKLAWRFNQANWENVMIKRTRYVPALLGNYFKVALRNLFKHKVYSAINIIGLSIGMASCLLILLYVQYEMQYDHFHPNSDRIYRVIREDIDSEGSVYSTGISGGLAPILYEEYPEIEQVIRVTNPGDFPEFLDDYWQEWARHEDQLLPIRLCTTDPEFLKVFGFPLLKGDRNIALTNPYSVLITQEMAHNFFKNENPMGKTITIEKSGDFTVTGVLANIPKNSTLKFELLTSTPDSFMPWEERNLSFGWRPLEIYLLLKKGSDPKQLSQKFPDLVARHFGTETNISYHLQPLSHIHLYSAKDYNLQGYGDISYVYLIALIAVFILLLACLNYVNLSTSRSLHRAKEVGMRKVVGAFRKKLVFQFLGESIFLSLLALPLILLFIELALPSFNVFMGTHLTLMESPSTSLFFYLIGFVITIGILSGIYPALFLSAFKPVSVLKGVLSGRQNSRLRKCLVVFQFAVSIFLLTTTGIVYQQLHFMQHRTWGFNKDEVVILPIFQADPSKMWSKDWIGTKWWRTREQFIQHPAILNGTVSHLTPPYSMPTKVKVEGDNTQRVINYLVARDNHFLETYAIELLTGRNFFDNNQQDKNHGIMLNETAVKYLGLKNPIGKQIEWMDLGRKMTIIGIMKDFQNQSANQKIAPMFLSLGEQPPQQLSLRIDMAHLPEVMVFLKNTWNRLVPERPFHFNFANAHLENSYRWYTRLGHACGIFALLALLIALLGLFGMTLFTTERRTKEIGVRKILGASSKNIVMLLSKEFIALIVIANAIIWPIAYYALNYWLQDFAYRIELSIWIFVVTGLLTLIIALVTVIFQTIKTARSNPINSLRYE